MTFRNRHSFIGGFLCAALFVSGGCALGGCTEITEPQGIGNADENGRMPLIIRATVSSYTAIGEENTPSTRIPTENGFNTEFNEGDAIGIFALKEYETPYVTPVDGVYNLKLVYTKATDGSGSWVPADDTKALYSYDDELAYIAYYPYRDGVTIKKDSKTEIFKKLANDLPPAADQSTPAAYAGSDLMAAFATPTTDPSDANKKVLTLAFEHLHALLVLKPSGLAKCTAPPQGGFEYKAESLLGWVADLDAKDAIINGTKALRNADGTFRAILKANATDAVTPTGSFKAAGDKTVQYTGTTLPAGKLVAGKYYTQQVDFVAGSVERALQVGDYFARDGKILARETPVIENPSDYVGIVLMTTEGSDADYGGNCVDNTVHGHVISVYDVATCKWGPNSDISINSAGIDEAKNDFRGYLHTQRMKEDGDANYGGLSPDNYAAAYYCLNYGNTDRGRLTATKTSGWYFPTEGHLYYWAIQNWETINGSLIRLVSAGYGQNIERNIYYWAANSDGSNYAKILRLNLGSIGYSTIRGNSNKVRAVLTF